MAEKAGAMRQTVKSERMESGSKKLTTLRGSTNWGDNPASLETKNNPQLTAGRTWGSQSYNCMELNSVNNLMSLEMDSPLKTPARNTVLQIP